MFSLISEFYPNPRLLAQPGPVVLPGKNVTLRVAGLPGHEVCLLQEGNPWAPYSSGVPGELGWTSSSILLEQRTLGTTAVSTLRPL